VVDGFIGSKIRNPQSTIANLLVYWLMGLLVDKSAIRNPQSQICWFIGW
jgi:hypothetical protein